jgi:hypothetical protein
MRRENEKEKENNRREKKGAYRGKPHLYRVF